MKLFENVLSYHTYLIALKDTQTKIHSPNFKSHFILSIIPNRSIIRLKLSILHH